MGGTNLQIYNVHTHTFTIKDVPVQYLPFGLVRFLAEHRFTQDLAKTIHKLLPYSDEFIFCRYLNIVNTGKLGGQKEVFLNLARFYPENTIFGAIAVDLAYMGAGQVPRDYIEQLDELADLKKNYGDKVIPFIHVDPRRPNSTQLALKYIEQYGFGGVKLYPSLGYFPYDSRLYPLYEYLETHQIPIVTHASPTGLYYQGRLTPAMFAEAKINIVFDPHQKNNILCRNFSHPLNFKYLLDDFPKLKINLAHFGGNLEWHEYLFDPPYSSEIQTDNWFSVILTLIREYANAFTDISYVLYDPKCMALLKILMQDDTICQKILFGSDYYMVEMDAMEKSFSIDVRSNLGERNYRQIAELNPQKFLLGR